MSGPPPLRGPLANVIELYDGVKGGRYKYRRWYDAPLVKRLCNLYNSSRVGKLSAQVSDYTHIKWSQFADWTIYKLSLFRVQRQISMFLVTFGAMFAGYIFAGHGNNLYTMGYR